MVVVENLLLANKLIVSHVVVMCANRNFYLFNKFRTMSSRNTRKSVKEDSSFLEDVVRMSEMSDKKKETPQQGSRIRGKIEKDDRKEQHLCHPERGHKYS